MKTTTLAPLCLTAAFATACTTAPTAERHFESGDLGAALREYEASESAQSLYFMAMIHLDPEWRDAERATALLEQLQSTYPESSYARLGRLWLDGWRERDRLAASIEARLAAMESLEGEESALRAELEESRSAIETSVGRIRVLNERIATLEAEIATLTTRLDERERELEELMSIDLDPEPLDTGRDPSR